MISLIYSLLVAAAVQTGPREECIRDHNARGCVEAQVRAFERLYGTRPLEAHRAAGDQVRRIYYVDGSGNEVAAITFVWPRGGDPVATVRFPRLRGGEEPPSTMQAQVPPEVWDGLIFRSANFDRMVPPRPEAPGMVSVCIHPPQFTVEAVDPPDGEGVQPPIRRRTESCEDGLASAFALEAQRAALPLFPVCTPLATGHYRSLAHLLGMCARLGGDRLAAATAVNGANEMREVDRDSGVVDLRRLFASDVVLDWNGQRATGAADAAALWAAKAHEGNPAFFFVRSARGEDRNRARITGWLRRFVQPAGGDPYYERAPVEQLWRWRNGPFVMASATVGAFAREPDRAD